MPLLLAWHERDQIRIGRVGRVAVGFRLCSAMRGPTNQVDRSSQLYTPGHAAGSLTPGKTTRPLTTFWIWTLHLPSYLPSYWTLAQLVNLERHRSFLLDWNSTRLQQILSIVVPKPPPFVSSASRINSRHRPSDRDLSLLHRPRLVFPVFSLHPLLHRHLPNPIHTPHHVIHHVYPPSRRRVTPTHRLVLASDPTPPDPFPTPSGVHGPPALALRLFEPGQQIERDLPAQPDCAAIGERGATSARQHGGLRGCLCASVH
mgnify:CR=1 FL=1